MIEKANAGDFLGRFREIVSDPLNTLIRRHELAGMVQGEEVFLHNGHAVPLRGTGSYYGSFGNILIINRGVHEPLEEYVFQQTLEKISGKPVMLELGAYWGHYSMWLKRVFPEAVTYLVEPIEDNLDAGRRNFERNGYQGIFIRDKVGRGAFGVDAFLNDIGLERLDILHCDIQGFEQEMVEGAVGAFKNRKIDYAFVSTHSEELDDSISAFFNSVGYRIEASSSFGHHTTSHDGFIFAASPEAPPVVRRNEFFGREDVARSTPSEILRYLADVCES